MQADYAIELGADDQVLEMPWSACEQGLQYYDFKLHPELLSQIKEVEVAPELGSFLAAINSPESILESAKCDLWSSEEINPEEEIFGARIKFGSYVDLLFSEQPRRFSLPHHEELAKNIVRLLKLGPEIPAAAEFLIRRCYYHISSATGAGDGSEAGFYITFYLFGYDADEAKARQRWAIGLKLAENAMLQVSLN